MPLFLLTSCWRVPPCGWAHRATLTPCLASPVERGQRFQAMNSQKEQPQLSPLEGCCSGTDLLLLWREHSWGRKWKYSWDVSAVVSLKHLTNDGHIWKCLYFCNTHTSQYILILYLIFTFSKLPSWARAVVPKIFYVTEKAWNYYPYTITGKECGRNDCCFVFWGWFSLSSEAPSYILNYKHQVSLTTPIELHIFFTLYLLVWGNGDYRLRIGKNWSVVSVQFLACKVNIRCLDSVGIYCPIGFSQV